MYIIIRYIEVLGSTGRAKGPYITRLTCGMKKADLSHLTHVLIRGSTDRRVVPVIIPAGPSFLIPSGSFWAKVKNKVRESPFKSSKDDLMDRIEQVISIVGHSDCQTWITECVDIWWQLYALLSSSCSKLLSDWALFYLGLNLFMLAMCNLFLM